ncbi:MAG TPA: SufD family Fe-S cluster assembly protein [Candidatus Limnocylindria bacterium]|nr:SufD family Fe-S cluster assembly protein [Candidatus Limnocylindria bacterium]
MAAPSLPLDRATVERLSVGRGEPHWLLEDRIAALERYERAEWPTGQEEEWRRFPLRDLPHVNAAELLDVSHPPSEYGSVPLDASRRGLVFDRWTSAVRDHPDLVRRWLPDGAGMPSHDAFRAWAGALYGHGSTFLHVPAGLQVELPLEVHKRWAAGTAPIVFRTLVVAEEGSTVTLLEELSSEGGGSGRVAVPSLEVRAGPGATVRYVGIQRYSDDVWEIGQQRSISERDSVLANFNVLVGSKRTKLGVESDIRGNGAQVKLYSLVAAGDHQRIDVNSLQRVDGKASTSDLLYLSALYESAHAIFYGVIRVEPTSSGTGSYQECRNMLLSNKAGADPIPVLEILTNDVARCGHGATAGRIDDTELFYIMSRGLDRATAEQLLVRGFFQRVVNDIPDVQVRARVISALAPRIGRIAEVEGAAA